jgi:adenylate kinase
MDRGALVSDELVVAMVLEELAQPPATRGAVLDGFPRTLAQAAALDTALAAYGGRVSSAIYLEVPARQLVWRLSGRRVCGDCGATYHLTANPPHQADTCDRCGGRLKHRSDDQPDVVGARIAVYLDQTLPLVDHYAARGMLRRVDGNRPIEQIRAELVQAVLASAA